MMDDRMEFTSQEIGDTAGKPMPIVGPQPCDEGKPSQESKPIANDGFVFVSQDLNHVR